MARQNDFPCPATLFTAEVNLDLLGIEFIDTRGVDLTLEESAAALGAAMALGQVVARHCELRRARRGAT
ncbi:hypothetical protein [Arenibaculum pallidiluteum]|uniref:hypothetical protein n=1 Tax=Arenibaculum pallidiluteum TaxID=2812559 RepID=UPI001A970149|nr:hypothetical protein [Arenibaculum pallidiluteum]